MVVIPVGRLAPFDQWDQTILDELFTNRLYPTGLEFRHCTGYPNTDVGGCVLIIPGRYWHHRANEISETLSRYDWVLVIRSSDEENLFDTPYRIVHNNIKHWIQYARADRDYGDARLVGVGYPAHFTNLPAHAPDKTRELFLSAQRTHIRRELAFEVLSDRDGVTATSGFTQGLDPREYAREMMLARVAPAPSGAYSPDSFRAYEALEAHTVPIVDDVSPVYDSRNYWRTVFPDAAFPIYDDVDDLPRFVDEILADWPRKANHVTAWWMRQKRRYAHWLVEDLTALGAI